MNNINFNEVKEYVRKTFDEKGLSKREYHNYNHTIDVVRVAEEITNALDINSADKEVVLITAWFHDIGYTKCCDGHEDVGVEVAKEFLYNRNYSSEGIEKVATLIRATRMPRNPQNILEEIICDADLYHVGTDEFEVKSNLFRKELEKEMGRKLSEQEWLEGNKKFMNEHKFYTDYAKEKYGTQKNINYIKLEKKLNKLQKDMQDNNTSSSNQESKKKKKESDKGAGRSIETMFRNTVRTHVDFSSMADTKANIMISVNTLILTIIVSIMIRKLDTNPHLIIPTAMLTLTSLVTLVYAILVTRPKVTRGVFTKEDIHQKKVNLLFFGNFHKMSLKDFNWGMKEMIKDKEFLYDNMISDFYYLGQVLGQKYIKLRICYTIFMYGVIISVLAFAIAFVLYPEGTDLGPLIE